jgi:hypothetical protein
LAGFDPITISQLLIQSSLTGFEVTIEDRPLFADTWQLNHSNHYSTKRQRRDYRITRGEHRGFCEGAQPLVGT